MQEKPAIVFLQETKCSSTTIDRFSNKAWAGSSSISVDASGASGGLSILWNPQIVSLDNFHAMQHLIQATFHLVGTQIHGHLTNVYFPQSIQQKLNLLETISLLNEQRRFPLWIGGGDFNIIKSMDEKQGGRTRLDSDSSGFKHFIHNNRLMDVFTSNGIHTWSNKRKGVHYIASRLDRFLISDNAIHLGGDFIAAIIPQGGSDHWPILLHWSRPSNCSNIPFRFEAFWLLDTKFREVVNQAWKSFNPPAGAKMYQFQQKLKHLKQKLKIWNRTHFGNIQESKKKLEQQMKALQQTFILEGCTEEQIQQEQTLWNQIEERQKQEEILWRQKSRISWLKEGEKNTKFFHRSTIQRRMHNKITFVENQQGERVEDHEGMEKEFTGYFRDILQEPNGNRDEAIREITQHVPKIINDDHNTQLLQPVSTKEVEEAMAQLKDGKAPGPDGFTANFFHEFWELIKTEVWELVEESRSMHWVLPSLNSTFIALVPKEATSNKPEKYRPIALCNVIYKLISKVISNRLKPLLPLLISPEQTGYVEGRQIMDDIILSNEVIHSLKMLKKPGMLLKLDLSKAFDKLSWNYIHKMLLAFGFNATWTRWIMSLITSPCFSVLLNGSPSSPFYPTRGIRQGDPLSPFLFVLMAEGLSRLLKSAVSSQFLKGISLHGRAPQTHQQFVDDTMLFGHPSVKEASAFNSLLSLFSEASGTSINAAKSQLFFFNTPPSTQRTIARILGFTISHLPSKYLGAPLSDSAIKQESWRTLLDKLDSKLSSWTFRALNLAGRLVLIKSVLQAMPLYLFSILAAPKGVLKAIRNLQRNFLWGSTSQNRKWALVKWTEFCKTKSEGGLGLRDPLQSNNTMGAKIWWNWVTKPNIPWTQLWQAKYARDWQGEEYTDIDQELNQRKIRLSQQQDKLRWGYTTKGTFTTKEAHHLRYSNLQADKDQLWEKVWQAELWPKISTFLWLLSKKRILTWDNLIKRGFIGPSRCPNCNTNCETIYHLLEECTLAKQIWEKVEHCNMKAHPRMEDITANIRTWAKNPFKSRVLNSLWNILPGFIYWTLWKERNHRIFNSTARSLDDLWINLKKNIQETLAIRAWNDADWPESHQEQIILKNWNLEFKSPNTATIKPPTRSASPSSWSPPAPNSFKMNFDGAAKGNPGPAGYGGVIRNHNGESMQVYYGTVGSDTNNAAELEGLWKGICLADQNHLHPLEVEGDSLILIAIAKRIQAGAKAVKVAKSWRLLSRLEDLEEKLHTSLNITFHHVRRTANKVADRLANQGVSQSTPYFSGPLNTVENAQLKQDCISLVQKDLPSPDAGDNVA
eukprot:PITA_06105